MSSQFYRLELDPVWYYCKLKFKRENDVKALIKKASPRSILKAIKKYPERWHVNLKFYLLRRWYKANMKYSFGFVSELNRMIRGLKIKKWILPSERDHIFRLSEVAFASIRTMKKLDVPFELQEKEDCYYVMPNGSCYEDIDGEELLVDKGNLYVTNKRIVIVGRLELVSINAIESTLIDKMAMILVKSSDQEYDYHVRCEDMQLLKIALKRTLGRKG